MSRTHLFVVVVLLGAASIAGLLAVTRTVDLGTAATPASNTQISARMRSLDRLEASLRRSLAEQPPALPTRRPAADPSAPRTVYVRSAAAARASTGEHDDDDEHGETDHESEDEHEGADD